MNSPHPWFNQFSFCGNCAAATGFRLTKSSGKYQCHRHPPSVTRSSTQFPADADGIITVDAGDAEFASHDDDGAFCLEWYPHLDMKVPPSGYHDIVIDGPEAEAVQS